MMAPLTRSSLVLVVVLVLGVVPRCGHVDRAVDDGAHADITSECAAIGDETGSMDEESSDPPCLIATPSVLDFGEVPVGLSKTLTLAVTSYCEGDASMEGMTVQGAAGATALPPFVLDIDAIGFETPADVTPATPLVIAPMTSRIVSVTYVPPSATMPTPHDHATILLVVSEAPHTLEVEVWGTPAADVVDQPGDPPCLASNLLPSIAIDEGIHVQVGTTLHLYALPAQGQAPPASYTWSVQTSGGYTSPLLPSPHADAPTYDVAFPGDHYFMLVVEDEEGLESCVPVSQTVFVEGDASIRVELTWQTPWDPDETDEGAYAGSDLDLHFAHEEANQPDVDGDGAPDPWFDSQWDCFWYYPIQNWGDFSSTEDDPNLTIDDSDGAGPEIVELDIPELGVTYTVGVHYWDDHGYGPAFATVRIYALGSLVYESAEVKLLQSDLWEVATISLVPVSVAPSTSPEGGIKITPEYCNPMFCTE